MKRRDFLKAAGTLAGAAAALPAPRLRAAQSTPDYVIVGAGSSGCALAYRLSAQADARVVVLEAGVSGEADEAVTTPLRWGSLAGSAYDWGQKTEASTGLGNRALALPQGKALGGSSAINALIFVRGDRRCYDRWKDLGNPGWGFDDVKPLFMRLERNESGGNEYRGGEGPLAVSYCFDPHPVHRMFLLAAQQSGYQSDARYDFNRPMPNGIAGYYQKTILDEKRHSAAAAYLLPAMARPNVEVRSGAQATRLVLEGTRVVGVEYVREGKTEVVRAGREVIVSAGVVQSPKLLMLSGIGPAAALKALGIRVVADVPGVGRNFQDHLGLPIRWQGKTELPASSVTAGLFTHSAPIEASTFPADLQFFVGRGGLESDPFVTITVALTRPRSRGEVRLRSADPLAAPIVRPNYLQDPRDAHALVRGVHLGRWIGSVPVLDDLRGDELEPGEAAQDDAALERYVRRSADTMAHGAGTCRMGPATDPMAVVDAALRVRGVEGLRVADASIMPEVVNATPHAACVMIGEKCADLIRS
jgi:choline dehydrogenase